MSREKKLKNLMSKGFGGIDFYRKMVPLPVLDVTVQLAGYIVTLSPDGT